MFSPDDRPMSSQFAVRVAVLGAGALIAFSIIFFRLWYLEVLSGDDYLVQAQENRTRSITVQAPRGKILDRNEKPLVENRTAPSLQVRPSELPQRTREANDVLKQLAKVSGMRYKRIKREIKEQTAELPASPVTLMRDAPPKLVFYLSERADLFPGVSADEVTVRKYPNGNLASHLFGFVSEVNEDQLAQPQYEELDLGDQIGAAGLEAQYDSVLRGRNGAIEVPVDSFGNPRGRSVSEVQPERGNDLVLSVDKNIQEVGEQAIAQFGKPAAFVVMNVNDGAVLGMGSAPNFDPSIYTPPVSFDKIEALTEDPAEPLFSNATQSGYPTGSTFKLVTSTAGLEEGLRSPGDITQDSGSFEYGGRSWINAGEQAYGPVNNVRALQVSSDIYFYRLGQETEFSRDGDELDENAFGKWASKLGFGSQTGIDLPSEAAGLVPYPEWRNELFKEATDPKSCGGTDVVFDFDKECFETVDRPWGPGDMMNLSVGQGDLQATPLQLALAYATVANGGQVVRPHVAQEVLSPLGRTEQEITPAPQRELGISEITRSTIMEGIRQAAMEPGGTSAAIFGPGYPVEIAGKTGTAEVGGPTTPDQSWYAAVAPFDDPQIAVVVTIEGGGFGSEAAAPAAEEIIREYAIRYLDKSKKDFSGGASADRSEPATTGVAGVGD